MVRNYILHQLSIDNTFGQDLRRELYEKDYIVEHLDNNGFNCEIFNLCYLKKIKNTYKGWYFDKFASDKTIIALSMYHFPNNKTFQITIGFNLPFRDIKSNKCIQKIAFLYSYDYEIVLQDAEKMLEKIIEEKGFDLREFKDIFRYKDCKILYSPQIIPTEEEKQRLPGQIIWRDGKPYIIRGEFSRIEKAAKIDDWDL